MYRVVGFRGFGYVSGCWVLDSGLRIKLLGLEVTVMNQIVRFRR